MLTDVQTVTKKCENIYAEIAKFTFSIHFTFTATLNFELELQAFSFSYFK